MSARGDSAVMSVGMGDMRGCDGRWWQFVARVDFRDVSSVLFAGQKNHVQYLGIAGIHTKALRMKRRKPRSSIPNVHERGKQPNHCLIEHLAHPSTLRPRAFPIGLPFLAAMFSVARKSVLRQARTQLCIAQPTTLPQYSALSRLLSTLAVLEQREGKLNVSSLAAITAGTKLGGSITAFVAGSGVKAVADEAAKVKGIEKVLYVENGAYDKVRTAYRRALGCADSLS